MQKLNIKRKDLSKQIYSKVGFSKVISGPRKPLELIRIPTSNSGETTRPVAFGEWRQPSRLSNCQSSGGLLWTCGKIKASMISQSIIPTMNDTIAKDNFDVLDSRSMF